MPDQRASRKLARFERQVSRTGIITTYLSLRLVARRGFIDSYYVRVKLALNFRQLMQCRELGFGLLQDGNVGISIFPQREEFIIGGASLHGSFLHRIGAPELQMRECPDGPVLYNTAVVDDFLENGNSFAG